MANNSKILYETPKVEILEVRFENVVCQSEFDRGNYGDVDDLSVPVNNFGDVAMF